MAPRGLADRVMSRTTYTDEQLGKHTFNLPGSSATIGGILDEADAVISAAKERK